MSEADRRTERIRGRAAVVGRWLRRLGWLGYSVAVGGFVVGAAGHFTPLGVTVVVIALAAGSALLLPGIVIGLGISAAERDERKSHGL